MGASRGFDLNSDSFLRNFGCPVIDAACSWKIFFAKSTPIIISFVMVAVLSVQLLLNTTLLAHFDAAWGGRQPPHLMWRVRQALPETAALNRLMNKAG